MKEWERVQFESKRGMESKKKSEIWGKILAASILEENNNDSEERFALVYHIYYC